MKFTSVKTICAAFAASAILLSGACDSDSGDKKVADKKTETKAEKKPEKKPEKKVEEEKPREPDPKVAKACEKAGGKYNVAYRHLGVAAARGGVAGERPDVP